MWCRLCLGLNYARMGCQSRPVSCCHRHQMATRAIVGAAPQYLLPTKRPSSHRQCFLCRGNSIAVVMYYSCHRAWYSVWMFVWAAPHLCRQQRQWDPEHRSQSIHFHRTNSSCAMQSNHPNFLMTEPSHTTIGGTSEWKWPRIFWLSSHLRQKFIDWLFCWIAAQQNKADHTEDLSKMKAHKPIVDRSETITLCVVYLWWILNLMSFGELAAEDGAAEHSPFVWSLCPSSMPTSFRFCKLHSFELELVADIDSEWHEMKNITQFSN